MKLRKGMLVKIVQAAFGRHDMYFGSAKLGAVVCITKKLRGENAYLVRGPWNCGPDYTYKVDGDNLEKFSKLKPAKFSPPKEAHSNDPFVRGVQAAAGVASMFDKMSSHDYLVSDVILCKLNCTKRKRPRKNKGTEGLT